MSAKYGDLFSLRLGMRERVVYVMDPEVMKQLFSSPYLANRPELPFFDIISRNGHGIGSRPYDFIWKLHTKILHSSISKLIQTQVDDMLETSLDHFFKILYDTQEKPFCPERTIQIVVLMMMGRTIFGHNYTSVHDPRLKLIIWLNERTMSGLNPINPINMIPGLKYISLPFFSNYRDLDKAKENFLKEEYDRHCAHFDGNLRDIMDVVIKELRGDENTIKVRHEEGEEFLQPESLLMSVFTLIVAGEQTLSKSLMWILLYLAKEQECQKKIYNEIKKNTVDPKDFVHFDNKEMFPYTSAFYLETLRHVAVTYLGVPRTATADISVKNYVIPKGTTVFPNIWSMSHNEKYWPNPEVFDPNRFLKFTNMETKNIPGFYIFGYGRRTCIGAQIGRTYMFSFLSNIVNKFHISLPDGENPDMQGIPNLIIEPPKFKLKFEKRS
ncbi:steroid 17-alpha-hydroxylase/17,20 lyase-like isoform X2 [Crassostrea virginica]